MSDKTLREMFNEVSPSDEDADDASDSDDSDESGGSRYSGSAMPDGGRAMPFDMDDPRMNAPGDFAWENFNAKTLWKVSGTVQETHNEADALHHSESLTQIEYEADLRQTERLGANIINLDFIFDPDVLYDAPAPVELENGRDFWRDSTTLSIQVDVSEYELVAAAIQRGSEDARHPAYILGGWLSQARASDQVVTTHPFVRAWNWAQDNFEDFPEDASESDPYGGYER